jgi:hypothetical protein
MPTAAPIRSRPFAVDGRRVDARADRPGTGQHTGQRAVGTGEHRDVDRSVLEKVEDFSRVGAHRRADEVGDRDVANSREAVDPVAARFGDQSDRASLEGHHRGPVCTLGNQRQRVGHRILGRQHHRSVDDQVAAFDEVHRLLHRGDRKVLRQNDNSAAAGHRLRHPPTRDRGHVGHHHRDRGAGSVVGGQIDVEA